MGSPDDRYLPKNVMSMDVARMFRFCTVGFTVAVVYVGTFTLLYHTGLSPLAANTLAFSLGVVVQYFGQTCWTFNRPLWDGKQSVRFLGVVGMGLVYSGVVASIVGPALEWPPWVSAGAVSVTLPVLNYASFRLWVYRPEAIRNGSLNG